MADGSDIFWLMGVYNRPRVPAVASAGEAGQSAAVGIKAVVPSVATAQPAAGVANMPKSGGGVVEE